MSSTKDRLSEFIQQAGEVFGCDEFSDPELEFEVMRSDDDLRYDYTDVVRVETDELYRFCLTRDDLKDALPRRFDLFRELEEEYEDEYGGVVLLWRHDDDGDHFWYIYRVETGEVGLFHSDYSFGDELEEEDGEEDEAEENEEGK